MRYRGELTRLREHAVDREEAREIGRVLRERPVLHADGDRDDRGGGARVRLIESGGVDGRIRSANAKSDLAIGERIGGQKCGDGSGAIDLAAERRLSHLETGRADPKLSRDRCAIGVASRGCDPRIECVALRVHREGDVRLAAHRIDPRPEPVEDPSGLSIRKRGGHRSVEVRCDAQVGICRPPRSRAVDERHRGRGPRRGKLDGETLADRARLERPDIDAADGHAWERAGRIDRVRREGGAGRKRDSRDRGESKHPDTTT